MDSQISQKHSTKASFNSTRTGWINCHVSFIKSLNPQKLVAYATQRAVIAQITKPIGPLRTQIADTIAGIIEVRDVITNIKPAIAVVTNNIFDASSGFA